MKNHIGNNYITLGNWFLEQHDDSDVEKLFVSMGTSLQKLHKNNLCVNDFYPTKIYVEKDKDNRVIFSSFIELSNNQLEKEEMISSDILKEALIHFSYYYYQENRDMNYYDLLNIIANNKEKFLFDGFSSYSSYFPKEDYDYYNDLFVKKNYTYYNEYKKTVGNNLSDSSTERGNRFVKKTNNQIGVEPISSEYVEGNKLIKNDDAFVSLFIIPVAIFIAALVFSLLIIVLMG